MVTQEQAQAAFAKILSDVDEPEELEDEIAVITAFIANGAGEFDPTALPKYGKKTGRRDKKDKALRVGDRVQIYGSARYGDPTGVIVGPHHSSHRVTVRLDGGLNDSYTPSTGRVKRTEKAEKPVVDGVVDAEVPDSE